jgi:hypothetical protein
MKKYLIGILAVVFAFAGAAFTAKKTVTTSKKPTTGQWYFLYTLNSASGEFNEANYTYINPQPASAEDVAGCDGNNIPCVILATGTQFGNPDHSEVSTPASLSAVTETMKRSQP